MQQTLFTDDDIDAFWAEAPRRTTVLTARITCRVCELKAVVTEEVPITSAGLLCNECRKDLDKTEVYIKGVLRAAEIRFLNARDLHQANVAHADDRTRERYERVEEALGAAHEGTLPLASVQRRYNEARARTDALGALLRERDKAEEIAEECARVQAWAERSLQEVEAARG